MNNVIIGAGQCGRGYIARLLALSKENFTFIDCDTRIIEQLRIAATYEISFCGSERKPLTIDHYHAYSWEEKESFESLQEADVIFTSVSEQHLPALVQPLRTALQKRRKAHKAIIITAENGTSPKQKLCELADIAELSESVIFCTTLKKDGVLDIMSEDLDHLPYDASCLTSQLPFHGMYAEHSFQDLLERKIYTYNALSACISYLGAYLGYTSYAAAANDADIVRLTDIARRQLDQAVAAAYGIDIERQHAFSHMAVTKFRNRGIPDTIERNARDVVRKLGRKERILAPLLLVSANGEFPESFCIVCAAALWYGSMHGEFAAENDIRNEEIYGLLHTVLTADILEATLVYYQKLMAGITLSTLVHKAFGSLEKEL